MPSPGTQIPTVSQEGDHCQAYSNPYPYETQYFIGQVNLKKGLEKEDVSYMPQRIESGIFHPAVVVSQGTIVGEEQAIPPVVTSEPEPHSEETMANLVHADVVGIECRKDGRVDSQLQGELRVENITSNEPKLKLAEATKSDDSLATARLMADSQYECYHWQDGLVFQTRLDRLGDNVEQLCLPRN